MPEYDLLSQSFKRIPDLRLVVSPEHLTYRDSTVVRGLTALPVWWKPA